jgi:hypothetical protein
VLFRSPSAVDAGFDRSMKELADRGLLGARAVAAAQKDR